MSRIEELKEQLIAAIQAENSETTLEQILDVVQNPLPMLSPAEEARLGVAMEQVEKGHFLTFEEYLESGRAAHEARRIRFADRKNED